jgi:DNA-binding NtrC family response regulator
MKPDKINILVADDELLIRDLLYDYLGARGYGVFPTESGEQTIGLIDKVDFHVAILDLKMAEKSGLEVMAIINERKPFVPVILMTAFPSLDSALEAIKLGAFEYMIKPFKIAELEETAGRAAAEYRARIKANYVRCGDKRNGLSIDKGVSK